MKVTVRAVLRDAERDIVAAYEHEVDARYIGSMGFLWTEGNYGCDCNRSLFLSRVVAGYQESNVCSHDKIFLLSLVRVDTGESLLDATAT